MIAKALEYAIYLLLFILSAPAIISIALAGIYLTGLVLVFGLIFAAIIGLLNLILSTNK